MAGRVEWSFDTRAFRRAAVVAAGRLDRETDRMLVEMADYAIDSIARRGPEDTLRYKRGYVLAGRALGINRHPVPEVGPSKYHELYVKVLARQVDHWAGVHASLEAKLDAWYRRKGRPIRGYGLTIERASRKARQRMQRAAEELAKATQDGTAVVFGAGGSAVYAFRGGESAADAASITRFAATKRTRTGRTTTAALQVTVRINVHGGAGRLRTVGGARLAELHNLEPHASVVERRFRPMGRALSELRSLGVRRIGRAAVERVARASGLDGRAA